jgi:hypothetical protein
MYCLDWAKAFTKYPVVLENTLELVNKKNEENSQKEKISRLKKENIEFEPYLLRLAQIKKEQYNDLILTAGRYKGEKLSKYFKNVTHQDNDGHNTQATKKLDKALDLIEKPNPIRPDSKK